MSPLSTPSTTPIVRSTTEIRGVFASDLIIRTAIIEALRKMRRDPWLLDWCFASLRMDPLTVEIYGQKEIDEAKKWFLHSEIPVFMSTRLDDPKLPAISIHLSSSAEDAATLGDVHYQSSELTDTDWPSLAGPLTPVGFEARTGRVELPVDELEGLVLVDGMFLVDRTGKSYEIQEVHDDGVVLIDPIVADLRDITIRGSRPQLVTDIESVVCKETYQIGCHVNTRDIHLIYLHSIVSFCLWRYRETLLEGRGFERSIIQSADHARNMMFEHEVAFSRYLSITGYVRQVWPKAIDPTVESVHGKIVATEGNLPDDTMTQMPAWVGEDDIDDDDKDILAP